MIKINYKQKEVISTKAMYEKPTANIIINSKNNNVFPLQVKYQEDTLIISIQHSTGSSS